MSLPCRFMPAWAPYSDSPADADFAMEHSGESFITTQLMLGMTTMESYNDFSSTDIQYGLEEEQRNKVLRTFVRNAFTFHLNEIFSAIRNEYTDWDKPIQHPINIRYVDQPQPAWTLPLRRDVSVCLPTHQLTCERILAGTRRWRRSATDTR